MTEPLERTAASIRAEHPRDHAAIGAVVAEAFGSSAEAELVDAIRASPFYRPELALVAEIDGAIVGHVMISGATLRADEGGHHIAMLSPLAVAPDRQRSGIGGALVRAVTERARLAGDPFVVLEGNPDYYARFGFEPASRRGISLPLPDWAPPEAAQILVLDADAPIPAGEVAYPPAFATLG